MTFDPQTATEMNHDYVRFYKDDSRTTYWGEEKYSGGRSGSVGNFPGQSGRPPLVIPAGRFIVYFRYSVV